MDGTAWVKLIQRIPERQHDVLVAVTSAGDEIMVQRIIIVQDDVLIFRGRPAGSTEQARIVLLPFDQLNHLAFNKTLLEGDVQAMFGDGSVPQAAPAAPVADAPGSPALEPVADAKAEPEPAPEPAPKEDLAAPKPASKSKIVPPSKSILLARLRERLAGDK